MPYGKIAQRGLIALAIILVAGSAIAESEQPPSTVQPAIQKDKGSGHAKHTTNNNDDNVAERPSIFDYLTPTGLNKIANYCGKQPKAKPDKWLHGKYMCDIHITDVFVAAFTGSLVLITALLFIVSSIQACVISRTARRQLRAYVHAYRGKRIDSHHRNLKFEIYIKNFGQTPGYKGLMEMNMGVDMYPPQNRLPPKTISQRPDIFEFPPNGEFVSLPEKAIELSEGEEAWIKAGQGAVYISGIIKYRDTFRKKRTTAFRLMYTNDSFFNGDLLICNYGNKAT
jgi:hypothetical protein